MSDPSKSTPSNPYIAVTTTAENTTATAENPPSPSKYPPKLAAGANKADSTRKGYEAGVKYINKWMGENNLPTFEDLTTEDVEADHLQNYIENIMHWLSVTQFPTPAGFMANTVKATYFSNIKSSFKNKFPDHEIWNKGEYWTELLADFKKNCKRCRINDTVVEETRKSAPLYRDLSGSRNTCVRAKYVNDKVDARGVAMGMLKEGSAYSIQKLAEFNLCMQACGRGGEHVFLRWTEMQWDHYFQAPDFDWSITKQTDKKCTLLFCDRVLYCLCPMFAMGLFMLYEGLRRDPDQKKGAVRNYVFPTLHNQRKEGVAQGLTKAIKKHIKNQYGAERADKYSSRSLRKSGMTHNRVNRNLTTQEEYARSGHMVPGMNGNAEGYVDETPAMSAPGGMSLAGYLDPHGEARPMSFSCLGNSVRDSVESFVSELFINDVECLMVDGVNREMLLTCAACVVGWYNNFVRDVTDQNPAVIKINNAAQKSQIKDDRVTQNDGAPEWLLVLKSWSKRIKEDFEMNNPQMVSFDQPILQQYMGVSTQLSGLLSRVSNIESTMEDLSQNYLTQQTLIDTNKALVARLEVMTTELQQSQKRSDKLTKRVNALANAVSMGSPASVSGAAAALTTPDKSKGTKRSLDDISEEMDPQPENVMDGVEGSAAEPAAKPAAHPAKKNALAVLGIPVEKPDTNAITVKTELERLWKTKVFKNRKALAGVDDEGKQIPVPKRALFDPDCALFFGYNEIMEKDKKGLKKAYTDAMTVVAISFNKRLWDTMFEDSLKEEGMRDIVGEICGKVQLTLREMAIRYTEKTEKSKFKQLKNLRSIHGKWKEITAAVRKTYRKDDAQMEEWLRGYLGEAAGRGTQKTINQFVAGK